MAADGPASYLATVIVPATAPPTGAGTAAGAPTPRQPKALRQPKAPAPRKPPAPESPPRPMISFVGAGPGAPDLITLRGAHRLAEADVVIWASSLVPEALLQHCRPGIEVHDSATMTLEDVIGHLRPAPRRHADRPAPLGRPQHLRSHRRTDRLVPDPRAVLGDRPGRVVYCRRRGRPRPRTHPTGRGPKRGVDPARRPHQGRPCPLARPSRDFAPHGATMAVFLSAARPDELAAELLAPGSALPARHAGSHRDPGHLARRARRSAPPSATWPPTCAPPAPPSPCSSWSARPWPRVRSPAGRTSTPPTTPPRIVCAPSEVPPPGAPPPAAGDPGPPPSHPDPHEPPLAPEVARAQGLRTGWTTGTCASAAAKAAVAGLLQGTPPTEVEVALPGGRRVTFPVADIDAAQPGRAAVVKDAGDDPDVTDGAHLTATAAWLPDGTAARHGRTARRPRRRHHHPARPGPAGRRPRHQPGPASA